VSRDMNESANDALGIEREFSCLGDNSNQILCCRDLNVNTHDYRKSNSNRFSPKLHVHNPPSPWDAVGVSAHANTLEVAKVLRDELERNGIDGNGHAYDSFVHYSDNNAFWNPTHKVFVYGQNENFYYAAGISVVAHEIFHGVTHFTAQLECQGEPGALNESYSDIFGVLFNNRLNEDISHWDWEIGVPEVAGNMGFPIRDLSNPPRFNQPETMENYVNTDEDQGGVHINNGIHNKAAYNLLTSIDPTDNQYLFDFNSASLLFYLALQKLGAYSDFITSRIMLGQAAAICFRDGDKFNAVVAAIENAFDSVGIQ
jgi:Zn-dependent metalloprotease